MLNRLFRIAFKALLILLLYNFIYPIRLKMVPGFNMILYIILLAYSVFYLRDMLKITRLKLFYPMVVAISAMLILALISILINSSTDILSVIIIMKYIFATVTAYLISVLFLRIYRADPVKHLISIMVISSLLISFTCTLEFLSPQFKVFLSGIINTTGNIVYEDSFRVHGLASGGGASLSVGLAVASVLSVILVRCSQGIVKVLWALSGLIIFVSTLLVGRTGIFLLLLFYSLFVVLNISIKNLIFLAVAIFTIITAFGWLNEDHINTIYKFGLEPVRNYVEYRSFESRSTNHLKKMYYFPEVRHILYGAGYWRYPTHGYELSDVGYMKVLMAYGIIGFLLFYLLQLYMYTYAYKFYSRMYPYRLELIFIFYVLFISELKEEFFTQNYAFKMLILLTIFAFTNNMFTKERELCAAS